MIIIVITGDLNLPDVEWSNLDSRDHNTRSIVEYFFKIMVMFNLLVSQPDLMDQVLEASLM